MEPELTKQQVLIYILLVDIALGVLFGLIPLILGIRRDRRRLGLYGFVASIVGGALTPLVSIVAVAIFSWLIIKKKSGEPAASTETAEARGDEPPSS